MKKRQTLKKTLGQPPNKKPTLKRALLISALLFGVFVVSLGGLGATAFADIYLNKGVSYGPDLPKTPYTKPEDLGVNPLGINTFLQLEPPENVDRILDLVKAGGYGFIRQIFPWEEIENQQGQYNWVKFDAIVEKANLRGLNIIARLDRPPPWSREQVLKTLSPELARNVTGPPDDLNTWGNFVETTVARYKGKVKYFQMWNEPNLESEWNAKRVDPARYAELLKIAYERAKKANPEAVVIAAALAPTDQDAPQFNNLNDLKYLDQFYKADGAKYYDVLAAQAYGLGYSPDFRYTEPDFRAKDWKRINFSRLADMRQVMEKNGDFKPVWVTEYGWISMSNSEAAQFSVKPWGESVDEQTQAQYLVDGIERARREWPWLGVMNVWFMKADQDLLKRADLFGQARYFAVVNPDWSVRPAYTRLQQYSATDYKVAATGWHASSSPAITSNNQTTNLAFKGERLDLELKTASETSIQFKLDGKTLDPLKFGAGISRQKIAEGLTDIKHTLEFTAANGVTVNSFEVSRSNNWGGLILLGLGALGMLAVGSGLGLIYQGGRGAIWLWPRAKTGLPQGLAWVWRNREQLAPYGMIFGLLLYYFAGPLPLAVAGAALLLPLAIIRPDWMIFLAVFSGPLYMHPRDLRESLSPIATLHNLIIIRDPNDLPKNPLEFSLFEVIIVVAIAAWVVRFGWGAWQTHKIGVLAQPNRWLSWWRGQGAFALPLLLFFLAAVLSLLTPEPSHLREAVRDFRVVVVEPLLLYLLVVRFIKRKEQVTRIFDVLVVGGVLIAGAGLYQFLFTKANTVSAEGVSRVISVFSHPDNLGLYIGRIIPLTAAVALFGGQVKEWSRRRWLYLAALAPLLLALFLSFSRGAWLATGLALLVMIIVTGSRRGLIVFGLGVVALVAALPFIKLERITSLFSFVTGSNNTRLNVWQASFDMIRDHPLTGIGLDQFLYKYQIEYVKPEAWLERFTSHPHNFLLDYWLRLGIIGPLLAILLLVVFFRAVLSPVLRKVRPGDEARRVLALGLTGSMVDFMAHGLVDNSYFLVDLAAIFCLSFGLVEVLRRESRNIYKDEQARILVNLTP